MRGTVKFFNASKGYGFITPDDGSKDIFVHITAVKDGVEHLNEGDKVEYDTAPSQRNPEKGPIAANVRLLS